MTSSLQRTFEKASYELGEKLIKHVFRLDTEFTERTCKLIRRHPSPVWGDLPVREGYCQ